MTSNNPSLDRLLEQISRCDPSATIRIQLGRSVVYRGTAAEAQTNSLTSSQIAGLAQALMSPVGQDAALKSATTITLNGETLYRSTAKEGVTVNQAAAQPEQELAQGRATALVEAAEPELIETVQPITEAKLPTAPELPDDSVQTPESAHPAPPMAVPDSPAPSARTTLSAAEVLLIELHEPEITADQTQQWLYDQIPGSAQNQLVQSLRADGPQAARSALKQVASLSQATADRALADSIVALTRHYGQIQEGPAGQFLYRAEKYQVTAQGNHYTLSDLQGEPLFAFHHSPLQVQPTAPCKLSLTQGFEIIQAGASLQISQTQQVFRSGAEALSSVSQSLAGMAPKGTFSKLATLQHQQAAKLAEVLSNSRQAIATDGGQMFSGSHFKVFKTPQSLRVFATDGRGELLSKVGDQVRSRMNGADLAQMGKAAQSLLKAVQQQVHINMHGMSKAQSSR